MAEVSHRDFLRLAATAGNRGRIVRMHEGSEPFHDTSRLTRVAAPPPAPASQAKTVEKPRS
jgi:hypothetical protein